MALIRRALLALVVTGAMVAPGTAGPAVARTAGPAGGTASPAGGTASHAGTAAAPPAGTALTSTGPSTLLDRVTPLVGSATELVYARVHQLASGAGGYDAAEGRANDLTAALDVRMTDGRTASLGH